MPGGAVPRGEVCKTGEAPARGAARSAAGGHDPPLDAKPAGGMAALPPKDLPRNASCPPRGRGNELPRLLYRLLWYHGVLPAPRAGERTLSAFFHWLRRSARLPELSVPGSARVRFFALPRYNHRAPRLQKLPFPTRARDTRKTSSVHSPRAGHNDSSASRIPGEPRFPAPACRG